jgi:signal transduction histidine kinase
MRTWAWWRRHRLLVDIAWMSPLLAVSLLAAPAQTNYGGPPGAVSIAVYLPLTAALCLPLIWRRRRPRAVFAVIALVAFAQWLAGLTVLTPDAAVLPAMYTVAAECSFRWAVGAGAVGGLGALLAALGQSGGDWRYLRAVLIPLIIAIGGVWILGVYAKTRRAYLRSLEDRAARLEHERDIQIQVATATERARIARELHDIVAHNVSVMVVQADGAAFAIDADPARAGHALEQISATGRQALTEMRRLLGVLREGEGGENGVGGAGGAGGAAGPYAPQPGVEQIGELVRQVRAAGLPVEVSVDEAAGALPYGLQLTIFRVVQEALTNTMKHGGAAAAARVCLSHRDNAVEVVVSDDGRGVAAPGDGRGHGLVGMRERVAMYGGTVRAGPDEGGGFEVAVRIPLREEAPA